MYDKRGMLHEYIELIELIDKAIKEGKKFGSINEALEDENTIHLTFDDGYKEHLLVAKKLKKIYNFSSDVITFSINIRNSFYDKKLCMDMMYKYFENKSSNVDFRRVKNRIFKTKMHIEKLNRHVDTMDEYFLNEVELKTLSQLFNIGSHCVNHCFLTSLDDDEIYYELNKSKCILEESLNIDIKTVCYPEGASSIRIRKMAKEMGYKFGLSISSGEGHYMIGRGIPR